MRLQRQSIKDSEVRGKWYFNIIGKDSELVEKAEHLLRDMGWEDECDGCPLYEDGESAGFWIYHSDVEQFKADWKIVKKLSEAEMQYDMCDKIIQGVERYQNLSFIDKLKLKRGYPLNCSIFKLIRG